MDDEGIGAEAYIAAIRAGAIDPLGRTADELQAEVDALDAAWMERVSALTPEELDAVAEGRMPLPELPVPVEPQAAAWLRLEDELAGRMKALHAQRARLEAEERELLAARFRRVQEEPGPAVAGLRQSDRGVERRMADAWTIVTQLPATHEAHKHGRISSGHLRVIEQATHALRLDNTTDADELAAVERELVEIAETTTPGRLRARAKLVVNRVLRAPLQQRHDAAREQRGVWMVDAGDGMVDVGARLPALVGVAIFDRLTQAAKGKPKEDARTWDQFRADARSELLLAGVTPDDVHGVSPIRATVTVTAPATELLRDPDALDEHELRFPALLDGKILADAATIRALAADTVVWERLFLHPVTGLPVAVDTYTPTRAQKRWLKARDGRCRWPGCANPVQRSDLDHTLAWADGGTTSIDNLAHLCRRHHVMKHTTRWRVRQLPGGVLEWTSPLGAVVRDEPEPQGPTFADASRVDSMAQAWELAVGGAAPPGPPGPPPPY